MGYVFTIAATVALGMIAYQDWRARSVYWWWFAVLAGAGFLKGAREAGGLYFQDVLVNLGFLAVQVVALRLYFLVRRRKDVGFIDKKIGLGDLLFLAVAACFFSPLNFIVFYVGSLVFAIVVWLVFRGRRTLPPAGRTRSETLPLAGMQAVFFIACLFISAIWKYSLLNDDWLIQKLGG